MANLLWAALSLLLASFVAVQGQGTGSQPVVVQGPPGQPGQPGLPGPPGERGYFGIPGQPGATGEKGEKGEPGQDAIPGNRGQKGDQGLKGATGPPGPPGDMGIPGDKGEQGDRGLPGLPGYQGEKGDRGDGGLRGPQGPPGAPGSSIVGPKGDKGDVGIPGQDGWPGDPGPIGPAGPPGPPGQPGNVLNAGSDCSRNSSRSFSASVTTPPHFFARLIGVITRIPPNKITFGDVVVNYGGSYDATTGVFQPPVDGIYNVMISIAPFKGTQAAALLKRLPVSNVTVEPETIRTFTVGSSSGGTWLPYSTDILVQLRQNDQLWVEAVRTPIMPNNTHFGAFLLHSVM